MSTGDEVAGDAIKAGIDASKQLLSGDYVGAAAVAVGDVAADTLGKIPVVGSTLAGAAAGAVEGVAATEVAAEAVQVVTTVVAVTATMAGDAAAAGTAIGIGAAIGNVLPIPGVGAAIGACIGALVAIGEAIASATTDTFHPTPLEAEAWLTVFRLNLCFIFSGVDNAVTPDQAARLARYFKIVALEVLKGQKGNTGDLYNPVSNDSCDNPYMCQVDPDDSLTDPAYLTQAQVKCQASQQNAGKWFDHGQWFNTVAGRLAAGLAGKKFAIGGDVWAVDADGFVTSTTGQADPLPSPPIEQATVTIEDQQGVQHVGHPLVGSKGTGAATSGVAAGWVGRPTVVVTMPRVGLLSLETKGWRTPTVGDALTGTAFATGTPVTEVESSTTPGWCHVQVGTTSLWLPQKFVAWNPTEQHLWQMQLENETAPIAITTPSQAKAVLSVLRSTLQKSGIDNWSEFDKTMLAADVKRVRHLAGETGPDPVLQPLLGDVTPDSMPIVDSYDDGSQASIARAPQPSMPQASLADLGSAWWDVAAVAGLGLLVGGVAVALSRRKSEDSND